MSDPTHDSETPAAKRPESASAAVDPPPRPPSKHRMRARLVAIVVLVAGLLAWAGYEYAHKPPAERAPADSLALEAVGAWWNVIGDRYLELDWEGRRASLWDYSSSEEGVESTGTWSASETVVTIHVSGKAGELTQQYELVGNDAELFLAPKPIDKARLLDSWIADHGDDEDDSSPKDSMSHETSWHHPHTRGRPRYMRHHHRHWLTKFPA
jgi:hypothetical protein